MADRRDAADHKTGRFPHEIGVCFPDRLAKRLTEQFGVDPVGAAGQHQHGLAALGSLEDHRFGDLANGTADRISRVDRSSG